MKFDPNFGVTNIRTDHIFYHSQKLNDFLGVNDSSNVKLPIEKIIQSGFIAQEVNAAAKSLGFSIKISPIFHARGHAQREWRPKRYFCSKFYLIPPHGNLF